MDCFVTTHDTRKAAPFFIAKPAINAPQKRAKVELRARHEIVPSPFGRGERTIAISKHVFRRLAQGRVMKSIQAPQAKPRAMPNSAVRWPFADFCSWRWPWSSAKRCGTISSTSTTTCTSPRTPTCWPASPMRGSSGPSRWAPATGPIGIRSPGSPTCSTAGFSAFGPGAIILPACCCTPPRLSCCSWSWRA